MHRYRPVSVTNEFTMRSYQWSISCDLGMSSMTALFKIVLSTTNTTPWLQKQLCFMIMGQACYGFSRSMCSQSMHDWRAVYCHWCKHISMRSHVVHAERHTKLHIVQCSHTDDRTDEYRKSSQLLRTHNADIQLSAVPTVDICCIHGRWLLQPVPGAGECCACFYKKCWIFTRGLLFEAG